MSAEKLLGMCRNVRRTGPGRWICSCPAHEDRHPSMNVKEVDDGKVLVICRSGCSTEDILGAVGLEWSDLFPDKGTFALQRDLKRAFPASDVLAALADEALLVAVAASNVSTGVELTADDRQRLILAANRIYEAMRLALGDH